MNGTWETHQGDEWWYKDYWCSVTAGRSADIISIGDINALPGQFTQERLHSFLSLTKIRFGSDSILLNIASKETAEMLLGLKQLGLVEYQLMESPYSKEAKIIKVQPYVREAVPQPSSVAKKKWLFW